MGTEGGELSAHHIRRPETRHEWREVNARIVIVVAIAFVMFSVLSYFLVRGLFVVLDKRANARDTTANPAIPVQAHGLPPLPRIQPDPVGDLRQMREAEDRILHGYAWIDQSSGTVRIPVARAMQLLVQRGIPARAGAPAPGYSAPSPMAPSTSGVESQVGIAQQQGGNNAGQMQMQMQEM